MNTVQWQQRYDDIQVNLKDDPNNGRLWLEYADFLEKECDNPQETLRAVEKAQQLLPDVDLRLRLGTAHDRAGDLETAVSLISESLSEFPQAPGFCILADIYLNHEMHEDAISALKQALQLDGEYEEAYYLLGEAVKHLSREEAIQYYRQAIDRDPKYQLAWQALGRQLIANEEGMLEGILALRKAVELNPDDGWARIFLANAFARQGSWDEAEECYKTAIDAFPDYPEFRKWYTDFLKVRDRRMRVETEEK